MEYVNLGNSGLKVSRICLGTMTYGSSQWRDWVLDEDESRPFFKRALELGINFFDTADMYSDGISEEITGRALRDFARRDEVVIATTPVIPLTAIQQRLDWAGVGDFTYKLITSIENMRANKPSPVYYHQIFNILKVAPEECLMIGDEDKDMQAAKYGCQTFLVPSENTNIEEGTPEPSYKGPLKDLLLFL